VVEILWKMRPIQRPRQVSDTSPTEAPYSRQLHGARVEDHLDSPLPRLLHQVVLPILKTGIEDQPCDRQVSLRDQLRQVLTVVAARPQIEAKGWTCRAKQSRTALHGPYLITSVNVSVYV